MAQEQSEGITNFTVDVTKKTVSMSGRDVLIALLMFMVIASWVYVAHFRLDTVDTSHAGFASSMEKSTIELLKVEAERSRQIEELLRINQRNTASLEVIAGRIGTQMRPYEEQRGIRLAPLPREAAP